MKISVPAFKIQLFQNKLQEVNKKLEKYGKKPLEATEGEHYSKAVNLKGSNASRCYEHIIKFVDFEIREIESFKKDDKNYRFIGSINYDNEIKIIHCLDEDFLNYFSRDYTVCDHCHTNRHRKNYYLFEANGNVLQIGSGCAADYFGIDVQKYLEICLQFKKIKYFTEEESIESYTQSTCRNIAVLYNVVKAETKDFTEWNNSDSERPTAEMIKAVLFADYELPEGTMPEGLLDRIRAYWEKQENSSFVLNIRESLKYDYVVYKNAGICAYGLFKGVQEMRKEDCGFKLKAFEENKYKVPERISANVCVKQVKCITVNGYQGDLEDLYIVNFISEEGVPFVTKTVSKAVGSLKIGEKISLRGIVSGIDCYRNNKSWILKWVKIVK